MMAKLLCKQACAGFLSSSAARLDSYCLLYTSFVYRKKEKTPELLGKFVILMIGRLSNEKRQDVLIDAVKKSKYSDNIQLLLAGQGPKYRALRRRGRRLKNPPRIRFYTHNELLNVIAMSDLYVHAADAEIEAISCIRCV